MEKILILDDQDLHAQAIAALLAARGYQCLTTSDPIGFVGLLKSEKPDMALVDVAMRAISGDLVVKFVKKQPGIHHCPLVLWSSLNPGVLRRLVEATGADGYICKLAGPEELENEVRRYLGQGGERAVDLVGIRPEDP